MTLNPSPSQRWALNVFAVAMGVLIGACSTPSQPAQSQIAASKNAVDRASSNAGVEAPVEIASAQTKLERARKAFTQRDYVAARQLGEQAQADAELAEAQSRSDRANRSLTDVKDGIRQLREEMDRAQSSPVQPRPAGQ